MKKFTRRDLIKGAGAVSLIPLASGCSDSENSTLKLLQTGAGSAGSATASSFQHGVASGDPLADRVILWTRVTPDDDTFTGTINVAWEIASDEAFTNSVQSGVVQTSAARDYTVKVDPPGLSPATTYYYRFAAGSVTSPTGRTKTAPAGNADKLKFVVASCSNYGYGYFHAYRRIAEREDLDAVIHLGDYIYEYGAGEFEGDGLCLFRGCTPNKEIVTLEDYRERHAEYKTDPDLQEAHRVHPWIVTWDDHEFANNAWKEGAENHDEETEGLYSDRKEIAARVFDEWMPIRLPDPGNTSKIFRRIKYGEMADLIMLDTRSYARDEQVGTLVPLTGSGATDIEALDDANRTILGGEQLAWLQQQLSTSTATWKLLGQQVIFAPLQFLGQPSAVASGTIINADAWDGYRASRQRVLDIIEGQQLDNVVILTGDVHSSWAIDVPRDPYDPTLYNPVTGDGTLAVEFATPAISMPGVPGQELAPLTNPHVHYSNTTNNGYILLEVTASQVKSEWWHVTEIHLPAGTEFNAKTATAQVGNNRLDRLPV